MDEFEKVERLRQRANVTYEEARDALKACDGDLLDAMVYLEKLGKVNSPENSTYKTNYEEQTQYQDVQSTVEEHEKESSRTFGQKLKHFVSIVIQKLRDNSIQICKKDKEVVMLPLWAAVIIIAFAWEIVLVAFIVSLFFDCHYSIVGKDDMKAANKAMNKAEEAAEYVKNEFDKL